MPQRREVINWWPVHSLFNSVRVCTWKEPDGHVRPGMVRVNHLVGGRFILMGVNVTGYCRMRLRRGDNLTVVLEALYKDAYKQRVGCKLPLDFEFIIEYSEGLVDVTLELLAPTGQTLYIKGA